MNLHTERLENQEIHWVLTLCLPLRENYFVGPKVAAFILYGEHYRRRKAQGFVGWKVLNLESKSTLAYTSEGGWWWAMPMLMCPEEERRNSQVKKRSKPMYFKWEKRNQCQRNSQVKTDSRNISHPNYGLASKSPGTRFWAPNVTTWRVRA